MYRKSPLRGGLPVIQQNKDSVVRLQQRLKQFDRALSVDSLSSPSRSREGNRQHFSYISKEVAFYGTLDSDCHRAACHCGDRTDHRVFRRLLSASALSAYGTSSCRKSGRSVLLAAGTAVSGFMPDPLSFRAGRLPAPR